MIVLDASAAIEIAFQSEDGIGLKGMISKNEKVISCSLLGVETASVVRKVKRNQKLTQSDADRYYSETLALVDTFYPIEELQHEAFRESVRLAHSVYDMFYFVLARRTGGTLFTTDLKLIDLCAKHGVDSIDIPSF